MNINLHNAISTLVESLLPRFSKDLVLYISIEASYSYFKNNNDITINKNISFLFERNGNYTKVLVPKSSEKIINVYNENITWYLMADHDSCWSEDGVRDNLSNIREEIFTTFETKHNITNRDDIFPYVNFDVCNPPRLLKGYMKKTNEREYQFISTKER